MLHEEAGYTTASDLSHRHESVFSLIAGRSPYMSALQDSLYGTDYGVALLSQEDTALHHTQSPGCSGSLLRGSLAITTTGLPPVSHQNLQGTPNRVRPPANRIGQLFICSFT